MVSIFTGLGAGFERGSGATLGGSGLLGSGTLGRSGEQVSLNAATGNLLISQRDEFLVGRSANASVARTYNSLGDASDDNGDNWRQSTDRRLHGLTGTLNAAGSTIKRTSGDGADVTYTYGTINGVSAYWTTDGGGAYDSLVSSNNAWTWTRGADHSVETYQAYGSDTWRIASEANAFGAAYGYTVLYSYNGAHLDKIVTSQETYDPATDISTFSRNDYIQYGWSGDTISSIVTGYTDLATNAAKTLTRTRYGYDASNRLTSVTVDLSPEDNAIGDGKVYVTTYTYDGASKRVASISETDGSRLDIGYDSAGRVTGLSQATGGAARVTSIAYGGGYTTIGDSFGQVMRLDYNADGSLAKVTAPPAFAGAAAQVSQFGYDASGNVTSVTDALGATTGFSYDARGNLLVTTDPLGNTVTRTYDAINNVLTKTVAGTDATGAATSQTTRYVYIGNVVKAEISAEGRVTFYGVEIYGTYEKTRLVSGKFYDVQSLSSSTAVSFAEFNNWDPAPYEEIDYGFYLRDARGNVIDEKRYSTSEASWATLTPSGGYEHITYTYDQAGQMLSRTVEGQNTERFVYDGLGRVIASTDLNGATTSIVFDDGANRTIVTTANGYVRTSTYNVLGEVIASTDSGAYVNGGTASNAYDREGRLRIATDATGHQSYFLYDATGRKVGDIDAYGALAEYRYDADDRLTATVRYTYALTGAQLASLQNLLIPTPDIASLRPASHPADVWNWTVYDADGRTAQTIAGDGSVTTYGYDASGRLAGTTSKAIKLNDFALARLKQASGPLALNRLNNSQFDGSEGWLIGYNPQNIVNPGSPYSSVAYGVPTLKAEVTATSANQVASLSTNQTWFSVGSSERLAVQAGVEGLGAIGTMQLSMHFLDQNGNYLGSRDVAATYGTQGFNTKVSGFVITPQGAASARLELYLNTSAAGSAAFVLIEPMVSVATTTQTTLPVYTPSPASDPRDVVTRNFYDKDGLLVGTLDGEGYLSRTRYDATGQVLSHTAFATATDPSLRPTGTLAQLTTSVGSSASDRTTRYVYDRQELLRFAIDAQGHVTEFGYIGDTPGTASGKVRQTTRYAGTLAPLADYRIETVQTAVATLATNAANRTTWSVYDAADRLAYAIDASGAVTGFGYDALGRVIKTTQFATTRATATLPTLATMTAWQSAHTDSADRVARSYYTARDELLFTVDAEGYITRYDYDKAGRSVATWRWDQPIAASDATTTNDVVTAVLSGTYVTTTTVYDAEGRINTVTDEAGFVTIYGYNYNGSLGVIVTAAGTADETREARGYDAAGQLIWHYDGYGSPEQRLTTYAYDGLGDLVSTTDADGATTTFTYDHLGRKLTSTDALGGVTSYRYDAFGEVVKTTDPRGNASYVYYDTLGRAVATRDAEDYVTETSYTTFGEVAAVVRRANRASNAASVSNLPTYAGDPVNDATTSFGYDRLGRIVSTTDALGYVESYVLDAFGQRVMVTSKLGAVTTNLYNRRGQLVQETLPISSIAQGGWVRAIIVTNTFRYDARGNRTMMVEAAGILEQRTTTYVYDRLNQLIRTNLPQVSNSTNTGLMSPVETVGYDARGNVIETVDAAGARTLFWYDALDRQIASLGATGSYATISYAIVSGTGGTTTTRSYATQVALPTTPGGTAPAAPGGNYRESVSTYDKLGRLASTSVGGVLTGRWNGATYGYGTGTITSTWQYDADGNVVKAVDGNGAATFSYYDKLGRKTASVDQLGYLTTWTLDAEGNALSERRYATAASAVTTSAPLSVPAAGDDRVTSFSYDRGGNRLSEQREGLDYYTIDATSGALALVSGGTATVRYTYNGLGQVLTKTEATGDATAYTYDGVGRLIKEQRASYDGVTPTVDYSYNGLGQLTVSRQEGTASNDRFTYYYYGPGGRLTSMTDAAGAVHTYYYDTVGRKIGDSYVRGSNGGWLGEGIAFQYDAVGNLVRQAFASVSNGTFSDAGDVTTFAYDAYGEMMSRALNGVTQEQSAYDTAGHLWRSTAGDGVYRYYLYDANGNRTLTLEDNGQQNGFMINRGIYDVLAIATNGNSTAVGAVYTANVNATITAYDARGQALSTNQTKRQLGAGGTAVDILASRTYTAFGETLSDTDALGHVTSYSYNAVGRTTSVVRASVQIGNADGSTTTGTPTDTLYYDVSGRLIGQRDANGNLTTRVLLAGTGYGQADALVVKEFHADGGVIANGYDVFGDLRTATDAVGRVTTNLYDTLGRLVSVTHPGGLVDQYQYDLLGQRTRHWNNYILPNASAPDSGETTTYDIQGRVIATRAFGGDVTTTSYGWQGGMGADGLGTIYGGTVTTTTYANGRTTSDGADAFGHAVAHSDMGGRQTLFSYDSAGRLTGRSTSGDPATAQRYTYLDTGLVGRVTTGIVGTAATEDTYDYVATTYGYDARGEKTRETSTHETGLIRDDSGFDFRGEYYYYQYYSSSSDVRQDATASYDALGRMISWNEAGGSSAPQAAVTWSYDAVGNIRHMVAQYHLLGSNGTPLQGTTAPQDYWYGYNAMNRVMVSKGALVGNRIEGMTLLYDAAGQRVQMLQTVQQGASVWDPNVYDPNARDGWGDTVGGYVGITYDQAVREDYTYNPDGSLATIRHAESSVQDHGDGTWDIIPPPATGALTSVFAYDALGRITREQDFNGAGYDHMLAYNAKGQVASETTITNTGANSATTINDYGSGSAYALGAVVLATTSSTVNGASQSTYSTATDYGWYDGAVQSRVVFTPDINQPGTNFVTTYANSASGVLQSAHVGDGRPRSIVVTSDALGQAIRRDETQDGASNATADIHTVWYRFDGKQIGTIGTRAPYAEFDQHYDAVDARQRSASLPTYTVRQGDTLAGIAAAVWGDANLWYKLAAANGLSAASSLSAGQTLTIPSGVTRTGNSASTTRPYDPSDAYGDTSPTTPKPQPAASGGGGGGCGVFGAILLVVVAIAVTVVSAGAAVAALGPAGTSLGTGIATVLGTSAGLGAGVVGTVGLGGAIAIGAGSAALGSIVSQGFGVATGLQDKFNWAGVALSALAGGISAGIGGGGIFGDKGFAGSLGVGSKALQAGINGGLGSALTQGVGLATGLQSKFDFAGVAAAGIGAGVGGAIKFGGARTDLAAFGQRLAINTASGLANAATRSLVGGTDFGDNVLAALPDIIGQTVGGFIAGQVAGKPHETSMARLRRQGGVEVAQVIDPNVRSDAPTITEDIIVTARRLKDGAVEKGRGFLDWVDGWTGFNLGGHNPHKRSQSPAVVSYTFYQPGVRTGSDYDRMGQPLNGRSHYDAIRQFNNIMSDAGNASLGTTFKRLGEWGNYTTPDTVQIGKEIWDPYSGMTPKGREFASTMDRLEGGTISGISTGVSMQLGADRATQDLVYGLGSAGDGLLIAGGSLAGARVPGIGNQLDLNIVNGENGVHGNSLLSGRTTYLYELQTKTGEFLKYGISVNPNTRYPNAFMADKLIRPITAGSRADMLALEKQMVISNPGPLNREPWRVKARGGN